MMVNVGGEPSGRIRETITKDIKEAEISGTGSKCEFQLKIPGKLFIRCFISETIMTKKKRKFRLRWTQLSK